MELGRLIDAAKQLLEGGANLDSLKEAASNVGGERLGGLEETVTGLQDVAGGEGSLADTAAAAVERVTGARGGGAGT
jgi:hypothetical protein